VDETPFARRVIHYGYDPLGRLITATYSTGESFEYRYDAVGNRTAMTTTLGATTVTTYTYDAANRLTKVGDVVYTWDDRGNLTNDGVFTYTYNAAGRLVGAQSITSTLVYTYNAAGLRVAQSVDGYVTTFAWDWAAGVPELLSDGDALYLVGLDTLGQREGGAWTYYLPDALGSIRQTVNAAGAVVNSREWSPYGVEVGAAQAGLGYTGGWFDDGTGLVYLRARWYEPGVGRFTSKDLFPVMNRWLYADANPVNRVDPSGYFSADAIARSFGVSNFGEVIQMFRDDPLLRDNLGEGRWGFLRLLQEAKIGNSLRLLDVGLFGGYTCHPVGQFRCVNSTIGIGRRDNLRDLFRYMKEGYPRYGDEPDIADITYWRRNIQGYYLNSQGFRDGNYTDLPDFATAYLGFDVYAPPGWGGAGVGLQFAYTVDRYGRAYLSVGGSLGAGVQPFGFGYYESYVNRWPWKGGWPIGDTPIASPGALDELIPGLSFPVDASLAIVYFSGEVNLDQTALTYWMGAIGVAFPQLSIGAGVSWTTERLSPQFSVNPVGWYWIELIPRYEEHDIPQQWDSDSAGCGC